MISEFEEFYNLSGNINGAPPIPLKRTPLMKTHGSSMHKQYTTTDPLTKRLFKVIKTKDPRLNPRSLVSRLAITGKTKYEFDEANKHSHLKTMQRIGRTILLLEQKQHGYISCAAIAKAAKSCERSVRKFFKEFGRDALSALKAIALQLRSAVHSVFNMRSKKEVINQNNEVAAEYRRANIAALKGESNHMASSFKEIMNQMPELRQIKPEPKRTEPLFIDGSRKQGKLSARDIEEIWKKRGQEQSPEPKPVIKNGLSERQEQERLGTLAFQKQIEAEKKLTKQRQEESGISVQFTPEEWLAYKEKETCPGRWNEVKDKFQGLFKWKKQTDKYPQKPRYLSDAHTST